MRARDEGPDPVTGASPQQDACYGCGHRLLAHDQRRIVTDVFRGWTRRVRYACASAGCRCREYIPPALGQSGWLRLWDDREMGGGS